MISKIIMQKTRDRQPQYVVDMIKSHMPSDWKYVNYINGEEEQFFRENPLDEFPDIINRFRIMPTPAHQADLFRFYYLYLYGGVTLDGDAMLYEDIEYIAQDYSFFSVVGLDVSVLCNGLMGASPNNIIVYNSLKYAYSVDISKFMNNYALLCKYLSSMVINKNLDFKYILYKEFDYVRGESAKSIDSTGKTLFIHYYKYKIIPKDLNTVEHTIVIGQSDKPVKLVVLDRQYINPTFILNEHSFNDRFSFEIFHNILIVKRIDAHYGWGVEHSVIIREA